ncbi:MAG: response regulator transcription factor [Comamonadaceae bacterium]|nr:MAG: response regulator transcription factor [Comamonadaceae bacterium]
MATVLLIDDHDIVRFGLETLLRSAGLDVVASLPSLQAGLPAIEQLRPDLVVTDLGTADSNGLDTVRRVLAAQSPRPVVVVSMQDETMYGRQVLALGAAGYLMKETAHANIVPAAQAALAGGHWISPALASRMALSEARRGTASRAPPSVADLTARELDVLAMLKTGSTTKEIARALHLSGRTVDYHRASIKQKLDLHSGAELIAFASQRT